MIFSDLSRDIGPLLESHGVPEREVYLDSENSGMIYPEALEAMVASYQGPGRGHPSITHRAGWEAYETLFHAATTIAGTIASKPEELSFVHSGTEANNLAMAGLAHAGGKRKKVLVSAIEHLSVMFPAEQLSKEGFSVVKIPVDGEGFLDQEFLAGQVDADTLLVSVAPVNHEIGTIQDVRSIVEIVHDRDEGVKVHLDASDAIGRIDLDLQKIGADLASFSSHKVYGPKGAGALFIREGIDIKPLIHGQLSTQKLWAGVENVPAIVGFAKAVELMERSGDAGRERLAGLRDRLISGILETVPYTLLNGPEGTRRSPDNANISILYCEGEALTLDFSLKGVYVSSGSACTSRVLEPSHVLLSIKRRYEEAHGSVLMKPTPFHTESDIDYVLSCFPEVVGRIRSLSPLKPGVA
jgi:cysteine desulfurase